MAVLVLACGNTATPAGGETVAAQEEALGPSCVSSSETSGWLTKPFGASSQSRFVVSLDARMGSDGGDALIGLSNGAAFHYTDLAAIARFDTEGLIDARNGYRYMAEGVIPYRAGQWHHLRFDVDWENHRYSLGKSSGQFDLRIADDYAFRTEQANVPGLNSFVLKTDAGGPLEVCNVILTDATCYTAGASGSFSYLPFAAQATALTVSFGVKPSALGIDGVIGLTAGAAGSFNDLAAAVRFNENGVVDVRNGGTYMADQVFPYAPNVEHEVTMVVDVLGHAYSVIVDNELVARNYAFRSQQASVASLGSVAFIADSAAGGFELCGIYVHPAQGVASLHHVPPGPAPDEAITDAAGNRYVAGTFTGTFDAGGAPLVSAGATDVYLAKYAPDGAHLWSLRFGGPDDDFALPPAVNAAGDVALQVDEEIVRLDTNGTEHFRRAAFARSPLALDTTGNLVFAERTLELRFLVSKLDPTGATLWVKEVPVLEGGATTEHITTDSEGNVLFAGGINGSIDVGVVLTARSSEGELQTFLVKLDQNGALVYGLTQDLNVPRGLTVDGAGNATIGGYDYNPDVLRLLSYYPDGRRAREVVARQLVGTIGYDQGTGGPPRADAAGYVTWPFAPRVGNTSLPLVATLEPLP